MAEFGIRFFIANIFICVIISILLMAKRAFKKHLTSRMQFNLWFLLFGLLAVPFVPVQPTRFSHIFLWLDKFDHAALPNTEPVAETAVTVGASATVKQISDFALSISSKTPSVIGLILSGIWLSGIFAMLFFTAKSGILLNTVKKTALPLQSREIRMLYNNCLSELKIKRDIPVYSTAFLKSPVIAGLFRPCIYLPIHLISDFQFDAKGNNGIPGASFNAADIRYMLLHELEHYRHRDAAAGCLMNLIGILYWFNPFVWYALKEMRDDREVACDTSVLKLLDEQDYADYGNTLLNFAQKVSLTPFPFSAGISGTMKQMQKRIVNISSYQIPSVWKQIRGNVIFALFSIILLGLTPMLSTYAAEQSYYKWNVSPDQIDLIDLSACFNGYEGSFVLYDLKNDTWRIHDMDHATLRTPPDSTYKIYDALFGLEEGMITPEDSFMAWNGTDYPFEAWNADQDLSSAMRNSVNWYFEEIDAQLGSSVLENYIRKIGYGNENIDSGRSPYWMQSTLKISPVEQTLLLADLYHNDFGLTPANINAVKDSICLFSSETVSFYGKTGTGRINGHDVNGWFIGYAETAGNTYFFAANIQSERNATGRKAAEIALAILCKMGILPLENFSEIGAHFTA